MRARDPERRGRAREPQGGELLARGQAARGRDARQLGQVVVQLRVHLPAAAAGPGPGEAVVQVHRVGICGTDLSGYLGKFPFYSYPRIPGHELGVEVLEVGDGVENIKAGDHCSVEPYINDVGSFASQRDRGNCCDNLQVLGVHTDGGMRDRFIVPARKLHASSGGLAMEQLALVET